MAFVGAFTRRPDADAKVRGAARYVADLDVPDAWLGGTVRADVARGRLVRIDRDPGFDFTRVVVVTAADIPGRNVVALITDDQPLLAQDAIEHHGEPIALVAAPDRATLLAALAALRPVIAARTPCFDMEASAVVWKRIAIDRGDVDAVWAKAHRVVEGTFHTGSQEQMYIEPQGCVAWPPDRHGVVVVRGSLQCPYYVQKALMAALDLPAERARVVACTVGGGFGGKEDYPSVIACHAALLARAAGRPVKLLFDRHEDLAVTPKRHPCRVWHRTAVAADGTLLAMDIDVRMDGGAYTTLSPVVLSRGVLHATGPYRCANVRVRGAVVATNHVPYGAFRGFGAPQTCFAVERQMDRIATELGMHPVALRRHNALAPGDRTATGQLLDDSVAAHAVLDAVVAETGCARMPWRTQKRGRRRRGFGVSLFWHGAGFTGSGETKLKSRVAAAVLADGRVEVAAAATEIGQGTEAMLRAIAADSLGCGAADVALTEPDTGRAPDSGPTVASRTCMIVGGLVAQACRQLRDRVGGDEARPFRDRAAAFVRDGGDGRVEVEYHAPPGIVWDEANYRGDAYPVYGYGADVVEVEVDVATFAVKVLRFCTAIDVGRAIQPGLVRGQIEGGSLQALGFGHLEVVTTQAGRLRQDRMATCIIPTAVDAPPMRVLLVERPFQHGPFGAKGVGEMPADGGAPALAAAIEDAIGIAVDAVPATPERLLAAWLQTHPEEAL
ncbi:MAG: xanthine dehydrogenase family protein [Planctomycetes bacterium]|nr:xanthine dehydrogenase family protein [Planctomycetota bacterium]